MTGFIGIIACVTALAIMVTKFIELRTAWVKARGEIATSKPDDETASSPVAPAKAKRGWEFWLYLSIYTLTGAVLMAAVFIKPSRPLDLRDVAFVVLMGTMFLFAVRELDR